jgi:uncharacterized protein YcbK (DUF882 family)
VSRYFTLEEFRCHSGEPYPAIWVADRLAALTAALDSIRDAWDGPIMVVCGYRTAAYNEALARASAARNGGASGVALNSQHIQGRAADIRPAAPTVERVAELHKLTRELYDRGVIRIGGLGLYPGWIHVDVRAGDRLATWGGVGMGEAQ